RRFVTRAGFRVVSMHPNEYRAPRTVGLWVDWQNLTFDPFATLDPARMFRLPGRWGQVASALVQRAPWLARGPVVVFPAAAWGRPRRCFGQRGKQGPGPPRVAEEVSGDGATQAWPGGQAESNEHSAPAGTFTSTHA